MLQKNLYFNTKGTGSVDEDRFLFIAETDVEPSDQHSAGDVSVHGDSRTEEDSQSVLVAEINEGFTTAADKGTNERDDETPENIEGALNTVTVEMQTKFTKLLKLVIAISLLYRWFFKCSPLTNGR